MYKIFKLQNAPGFSPSSCFPDQPTPTIVITMFDNNWKEAYQNWISGKNPTDSLEWKKGVYACCADTVILHDFGKRGAISAEDANISGMNFGGLAHSIIVP